ncbi:MAG TPA: ribosome silencing factor [Gammaproteobacteria bacterium]|nr:ribosome silencing factor [Gammaproteobacteria bacterium]
MTSEQLADIVITALEELKATDINCVDVRKLTSICDIMIFASGNSNRQVKALADNTVRAVKASKIMPLGTEGIVQGDWALVDLGDVIVHIMRPSIRDYYQLEKLWTTESAESRQQSLQ